ncbi:response regulator [Cnuella takakiae]|nr:response regulator [Cnuella takakiae]
MMKKHTILWAYDDIDDQEMFREILEAHTSDHEVVAFPNGKELLKHLNALARADHPCLIVLDLNMPILGGRETLAALKADVELSRIPIVLFTTSSSPVDLNYSDSMNVEMITKPPSYSKLKSIIEHLVDLCSDPKTTSN